MKKNLVNAALYLSLGLSLGLALAACTDTESDLPRLEFHGNAADEISVGDTTEPFVVTKFSADLRGKETSNDAYTAFFLKSSDSSVVKVVFDRQLVGVKPGSAKVTALDNVGNARTEGGLTVTVIAKP